MRKVSVLACVLTVLLGGPALAQRPGGDEKLTPEIMQKMNGKVPRNAKAMRERREISGAKPDFLRMTGDEKSAAELAARKREELGELELEDLRERKLKRFASNAIDWSVTRRNAVEYDPELEFKERQKGVVDESSSTGRWMIGGLIVLLAGVVFVVSRR